MEYLFPRKIRLIALLSQLFIFHVGYGMQKAYPDKPITIINSNKPGGAIDIMTRKMAMIAKKYDGTGNRKGVGRKRITAELEDLIIMLARKNKTWGSRRIKGALKHLGYKICHTTIDKVLIRNGYDPSPDRTRRTRWSEFIKAHWDSLCAIDFFTHEIYTWAGLTRYYVLVIIDYATRKVENIRTVPIFHNVA